MLDENIFHKAVHAIDNGDIKLLEQLLNDHPNLVSTRFTQPDEGYFKYPYLLWHIAYNPIRQEKMPPNIVAITQLIIDHARKNAAESFQHQVDYTLGLVATGSVSRESGVQIELIDLLLNEGAIARKVEGTLAHGNIDAAKHLIGKGASLTLTAAICLDLKDEIPRLTKEASIAEKQVALIAAAFYGKSEIISFLLSQGVNPNDYIEPSSGFHSHATALHQAVYSGSIDAVKILIEAGANPELLDRVYNGTSLGWAKYMQTETDNESLKKNYAEIEKYLSNTISPNKPVE